jgi:hypothetical protein
MSGYLFRRVVGAIAVAAAFAVLSYFGIRL